jgi:hypothetical protein
MVVIIAPISVINITGLCIKEKGLSLERDCKKEENNSFLEKVDVIIRKMSPLT